MIKLPEIKTYSKSEIDANEIAQLVKMSGKVVLSEAGSPSYTYVREVSNSKLFARIPHPFGVSISFITEDEVIEDVNKFARKGNVVVEFYGPSILIEKHQIGG